MKKDTKSKTIYYVAIILLLIALIGSLVANTYARYANKVSGKATATAAEWSFTASGLGTTATPIKLSDTLSTTYANLKANTIAPGTSGSFTVALDGTGSETGIKYTIGIEPATGTTLPDGLTVSISGASGSTDTGYIAYNTAADAMKKTITVEWKWTFGDSTSDDNYDTNEVTGANNADAGESYSVNVVINAEQYIGTIS